MSSALINIPIDTTKPTSFTHQNNTKENWSIECHLDQIYPVGCPLKHKISHSKLLMGDMLCLYVGDPWKKFQIFISIFDRMRNTFVAGYDSALL